MNSMEKNDDNPSLVSVQISDEEHALILMFRTMSLKEIIHVMMLNTHLPAELHDRYDHIKNIVNLQFQKSYQIHTIKTIVEFISTQSPYASMFEQYDLDSMIQQYRDKQVIDSANACSLYLKPYTDECIECKKKLKLKYCHRPKTVMSLTKHYKTCSYHYHMY